MKNNSSKRGYLSRLAQPLLPREPVLKARHIAPPTEIGHTNVPVIEDRFEITRYAGKTKAPSSPAESSASNPNSLFAGPTKTQEQFFVTEGQPTILPVTSSPSSGRTDADRDEATSDTAHHRGQVMAEPRRNAAEHVPVAELHHPLIVVSNEKPDGAASPHRQDIGKLASTGQPTSAAAEKPSRLGTDPHSVDGNAPAITQSNIAQSNEDGEKRSPAKEPFVSKPSAEGRRVHIGAVVVRAVLPQPPTPPVPPRPTWEAAALRGRSSADEPVARGLAWSYGLVQG